MRLKVSPSARIGQCCPGRGRQLKGKQQYARHVRCLPMRRTWFSILNSHLPSDLLGISMVRGISLESSFGVFAWKTSKFMFRFDSPDWKLLRGTSIEEFNWELLKKPEIVRRKCSVIVWRSGRNRSEDVLRRQREQPRVFEDARRSFGLLIENAINKTHA